MGFSEHIDGLLNYKNEDIVEKQNCLYLKTLKTIIDNFYDKEMVFMDCDEIYSRKHCGHITPHELCEWAIEITKPKEDDYSGETI